MCFQQITPGTACPASRVFTSKAVGFSVTLCDLTTVLSLSFHCCPVMKSLPSFAGRAEWIFVHVWLQVSTAAFIISFQDGCYKSCPAKTYSVEEEMTCAPCDDNCVSCDQHECYWCETDLFLSGKADAIAFVHKRKLSTCIIVAHFQESQVILQSSECVSSLFHKSLDRIYWKVKSNHLMHICS